MMHRDLCSTMDGSMSAAEDANLSDQKQPAATPAPEYGQPMAAHVNRILPDDTVTGRSLLAVVAIMSFLAAIAVGAVEIVQVTAAEWRTDVMREVTIQLRPLPGRDM